MDKPLKGRRIDPVTLERIMRDVLAGMGSITRRAGTGGRPCELEILRIEKAPARGGTAQVLPFPGKRPLSPGDDA